MCFWKATSIHYYKLLVVCLSSLTGYKKLANSTNSKISLYSAKEKKTTIALRSTQVLKNNHPFY